MVKLDKNVGFFRFHKGVTVLVRKCLIIFEKIEKINDLMRRLTLVNLSRKELRYGKILLCFQPEASVTPNLKSPVQNWEFLN